MTDFKNLNDIFNDSDFENLIAPLKPKKKMVTDHEVEKFIEIVDWMRENNGHEPQKSRDIKERSLYSRLNGIRKSPDSIRKLEPYDEFGLLKIDIVESETPISSPASLTDILSDELIESVNSAEKSLFDVSNERFKRVIKHEHVNGWETLKIIKDYLLVFMMKLVKVVVKSEILM